MYDNKVRLSQDVLEKAQLIAAEWGLKNARAAVEAVFRKYADEYLRRETKAMPVIPQAMTMAMQSRAPQNVECEAITELDELLGL
jgi:hypothetical protein